MKLNRSSGKRAGEIECSLSQEDLSTASAIRIWIRFCAINVFRVVGRPAMPTVCSMMSIFVCEGRARRARHPGLLRAEG